MTDLLTGNYLDELRREYTRAVAPLAAALDVWTPPPVPSGVAANPSTTPAAGEQSSCCPLPATAGVDSTLEMHA